MISIPSGTPKKFNLLGIGYRGVGKTVFLAGSYAELQIGPHISPHQRLSFDCQDNVVKRNIESLLKYIAQTGNYPPPTVKITNFSFDVIHHTMLGRKTLCTFSWWDIPGESCTIQDPDFRTLLMNSHGCCLFIDSHALLRNEAYLESIEGLIKRVEAIASLVNQNRLSYPFALILTKCDLLELGALSLVQLEEKLKPLMSRFDAVNAHYRTFYSALPLVNIGGSTVFKATNAAQPILWLTDELRQAYRFQAPQVLASGFKQIFSNSTKKSSMAGRGLGKRILASPRNAVVTAATGIILLGGIFVAFLGLGQLRLASEQLTAPEQEIQRYETILKDDPNNSDALVNLASQHTALGQYDQAIPYLEQLAQLQPQNMEVRFELAGLYALTDQSDKEEAAYDQILSQDSNNLAALTSKAKLRVAKGDPQTAKSLFAQAEKTAPTSDLKATVREIAQDTLK